MLWAGFKVPDIHFRQEERTELKHVTFENMPICTDIRWQNSSARGREVEVALVMLER